MVQELRSFVEWFGDLMAQTNTPKSMEEVASKVMKVDHGSCEFEYGESKSWGEHFKKQIGLIQE